MVNTLLMISFLGTEFKGSQIQKNLPTAQKLIQDTLSTIYGYEIKVRPCSRLDASVHALKWAVNFKCAERKLALERLTYSLNRLLPSSMHVLSAQDVPLDFDSRYDVYEKTYLYRINIGEANPLTSYLEWTPIFKPDLDLFIKTLKLYEGKHNFISFTSENTEDTIKDISAVSLTKENDILNVRIKGRSFLRYQIRFMIGNAYEVACNRLSEDEIKERLSSSTKQNLKFKAPGHGLILEDLAIDFERSKNVKS